MKLDRKPIRSIALSGLLCYSMLLPHAGFGQFRDSLPASDSMRGDTDSLSHSLEEKPVGAAAFWLMAAGSFDFVYPSVGNDLNVFGYSYRVGATWRDFILLFTDHATGGSLSDGTPSEEHRYDYAYLAGFSHRIEFFFLYAGVGLSVVDYSLRGNLISPASSPYANDARYEQRSGTAYGVAATAAFDIMFCPYIGAGIGVYHSWAKGVSYTATELTPLVLSLPIPFW